MLLKVLQLEYKWNQCGILVIMCHDLAYLSVFKRL